MKSAPRGDNTSHVEVSGISAHGVWLLLGNREIFLAFKEFPWFRDAPVSGVLHVERPQPHHLYWPDLDIDLSVDSILNPEHFPLVSRERPTPPLHQVAGQHRRRTKPRQRTPRR
jgi:hypothetical protein